MKYYYTVLILLIFFTKNVFSQSYVHPGLLHTQTDLDRMKDKVAENAHPWIDGWNKLLQDPKAQNNYNGRARANMNLRQVMSDDAIAAYLNALRWYISGDTSYAQCAIGILNNYSTTVNQIPTGGGTDIDGLGGIGVAMMCNAAEIMKLYSGWNSGDVNDFKDMMVNYFYPLRHDFLTNHRGSCITNYWANWDANNITALLAIGVLADNQAIYDEGIDYFYNGAGNGNINTAVYYVHPGGLGQWQESGRDQDHAQLGVGLLGDACQIAWNQGDDLFGYDNNRLLAGAEYTAKYKMMLDVPVETYDNCQPANHDWPAINGRGKIHERPIWEMLYNHYVVRQGISAPFTEKMTEMVRPEGGSKDHLGYGTLTFTLESSDFPPNPVPGVPLGLNASAGTGQVTLTWEPPSDLTANGYVIQRSTSSGGGFSTIETYDLYVNTKYIDNNVTNGTTYYYRVAAVNQVGTGKYSAVSNSAQPLATSGLPSGWSKVEIGSHNAGGASYASVRGGTFVVDGYGTGIGGSTDNATYVYRQISGDGTITGRINSISGTLRKTGLMIRELLDANAKTVSMTLGEGGWRFARMGYRTSSGANMSSTLGNTYTWQPAWFRISRSGNTFTVYESSDGSTWFEVDSINISMSSSYYIGLVVCSGDTAQLNTTVFDNITVEGSSGTCSPTAITPVLRIDGGSWQTTTSITIDSGQQVQFGPQPVNGGAWSWTGCGTSGNSREQSVTPTNSCSANAIYTNSCGTQSSVTYNITVIEPGVQGVYQLRNRSTGLYLDGLGETSNGAMCGQWVNTSSTNAQWNIQEYNGNYSIQNVETNLFLDGMGRTSNGDDVGQWDNPTSTNAQWDIEQYDGIYYRIQNIATNLYLDGMGRTSDGDPCGQWSNSTSSNAQWELISISSLSSNSTISLKEGLNSSPFNDINLYPNPVSSRLYFKLPVDFKTGTVKVFNLNGKLCSEYKILKKDFFLSTNNLRSGMYFLKVGSENTDRVWSMKFIKQ